MHIWSCIHFTVNFQLKMNLYSAMHHSQGDDQDSKDQQSSCPISSWFLFVKTCVPIAPFIFSGFFQRLSFVFMQFGCFVIEALYCINTWPVSIKWLWCYKQLRLEGYIYARSTAKLKLGIFVMLQYNTYMMVLDLWSPIGYKHPEFIYTR